MIKNKYSFYEFGGMTILLLGATGSAKTTLLSRLVAKLQRKIVSRGIGSVNSTIAQKKLVLSSSELLTNKIIISAERKEIPYTEISFKDFILGVIVEVAKKSNKKNFSEIKEDLIKDKINEFIGNSNNYSKTIELLNNDELSNFKNRIKDFIDNIPNDVFNQALLRTRAKLIKSETTVNDENSKLDIFIGEEFKLFIDNSKDISEESFKIFNEVNEVLKEKFNIYFKEENCFNGVYFAEIIFDDNGNILEGGALADAFFKNNNKVVTKNQFNLSIEVLMDNINVYTKMAKELHEYILKDVYLKSKLINNNGDIELAIIDRMGLIHKLSDDKNVKYEVEDLLYNGQYDGILFVRPLKYEQNEAHMELLNKTIMKTKREKGIAAMYTKLDLLTDDIYKDYDGEEDDESELYNMIISNVDNTIETKQTQLVSLQEKKSLKLVKHTACYFKRSAVMPNDMKEKYEFYSSFGEVLKSLVLNAYSNTKTIKFLSSRGEDLDIDIDENYLSSIVKNKLKGKLYQEIRENLIANKYICPHGNGERAWVVRRYRGDGYKSVIDESYFVNVQSFDVNFPRKLKVLSRNVIENFIESGVNFSGGYFNDENDIKNAKNILMNEFNSNLFSKKIIYDYLYQNMYKSSTKLSYQYGFGRYFDFADKEIAGNGEFDCINIDIYINACIDTLKESFYRLRDYYISYC